MQLILDHAPKLKHLYFDAKRNIMIGGSGPGPHIKMPDTMQLEILDIGKLATIFG